MKRAVQGMVIVAGMALSGCGGSGGASSPGTPTAPLTTPSPEPTPSPSPTPAPSPEPTPTPSPSPGLNLRPVAKVGIKIEYIVCPDSSEVIYGPFNWTSVGCRIQMDLTPKDKYNRPTEGTRGHPEWILNDPSLVYMPDSRGYTPVLKVERAGKLVIQGELDGIKSNIIQIHLY